MLQGAVVFPRPPTHLGLELPVPSPAPRPRDPQPRPCQRPDGGRTSFTGWCPSVHPPRELQGSGYASSDVPPSTIRHLHFCEGVALALLLPSAICAGEHCRLSVVGESMHRRAAHLRVPSLGLALRCLALSYEIRQDIMQAK